MNTRIGRTLLAAVSLFLFCALAVQMRAATITVTNTNDSGPGSLRQALSDASNGDRIVFAVTGTIVLTSGELVIEKYVTISGPGADQLSIDGNQSYWIGLGQTETATISGLTIRNCLAGIINDHGALTVTNCVIRGNSYCGIAVDGSIGPAAQPGNDPRSHKNLTSDAPFAATSLTIANSIVTDNSGPGVYNFSAMVTILNSTISGNSAGQDKGYGGGIYTDGGKLPGNVTITNSTISGNFAFNGGGGIACGFSGLTVVNSAISGNAAGEAGGGIAGNATIVNSTISGNSAGDVGGGVLGSGDIRNSTLSGNSAASGGGIYNVSGLEISNTILNAGGSGENIFNNGGTVISNGHNLSSDDGGGYLNGPGDQINTDPLLGPLQDNGGPTLTHAPLPGSPAINADDPSLTPPPYYDQRGPLFRRVFNRRIDVGSLETQPTPPPFPRPRPTPPR